MNAVLRRYLRQYQGFVVFGLILLVCVGASIYGLFPAGKRVFGLVKEREALVSQVAQLRTKASLLGSLDENTLRTQLLTLTSAVPTDKAIPSVFSTVERLAAESGMVLGGVTVANPGSLATESAQKQTTEEKKLGSNMLTFTALLEGTPVQVLDFFDRAVKVRRSLRVRFFDFSRAAGDIATVRVAMDAFYAPLPTALGDIADPIEILTPQEEEIVANISRYPLYAVSSLEAVGVLPATPSVRDPFAF
ncbi:hypothetical protein A3A64_00055 [Candidatus Gottesmanbacteria bacterium RIFCSPLOWO2_01_FULL_48_11]|uniref:Type IV pilus assembly protein PilO n=3 Tax=Candidatus Gottesmaniibacteriota TaxID=1752720 RepID=A0A0G1X160_9BACT|nr:MAG: hypothetical protein UY16_C0015G0052 [Candidatus Gottesmanbacteria bacterium GW2011_GWA2_47_9]KKU96313.1 MAG: hypothetical protein UY27_C0001G0006 [Candidatus Gottesmanbacteria bacterium GW2011_GWA1_48_13]OGG28188.1 MAG: hypothetical protein A3A64_00055 [Candidatus Gottesmanbacteria bacterium RIFCSPLOWO2_01_FULL_48_11]